MPQIIRKRSRHTGWPPSPARILNQKFASLGIPYDSQSSENALGNYLSFGPARGRLSKTTEVTLPLVLWQDLYDLPKELLQEAENLRM
ncbi:MAG: hypothetical protein ACE5KF_11830, partial [Kiloniellaceae bacterium]